MLLRTEFMLADAFEVTGTWWLPEKPDEPLYGTLRYRPPLIELELDGTFGNVASADLTPGAPEFEYHSCIHGLSQDRQKYTVLRAYATSLGNTTKHDVLHVITGKHVPPLTELKLRRVSFYCHNLHTFIARDAFAVERDRTDGEFTSCTVKYVQPKALTWRIDEIGATFSFQTALKWEARPIEQQHVLRAQSFVTITPDSPQEIDWYIHQIWWFCHFLTLVTDETVSPTGIRIFFPNDDYPSWYLYRAGKERESDEAAPMLLFRLAHLVDSFEPILKRWFSASEMLSDAIHLLMDAQRNQDHTTHGRFLLLAHAVEVASRATTFSEYMAAENYEKVIRVLNEAIPKEVESDHRASLKNKIKYGNEFSYYKRINVLLESLSEEGRKIVCKNPREFSRGIADTRNYYTHFTDELRLKALPPVPMYWAAEKLSFLLRIVLLRYLGVPEEIIVSRMTNHHRLLQRIACSKEYPEVMMNK
ncbi:MAG: HEPN domain-containing protein [Pirellulales bacterium]